MFERIKKLVIWLWTNVWAGLGLALLGTVVVVRLVNGIVGPSSYKVFFVGDFGNPAINKVWIGFKKADLHIDNVLVTLEKVDAKDGDADLVSKTLARRNDILMVVGHGTSTATKNALPNYIRINDFMGLPINQPIPVILPTESSPNVEPPTVGEILPVLRLAPTDEKQAEGSAKFAIGHDAQGILVVEDESNSFYTHYLAEKFITDVHEQQIHKVQQKNKENVSKVLLWTTSGTFSADAAKALGVDFVYFAGTWSNALILIRQIKQIWKNQPLPKILLSDACATSMLIPAGGADVMGIYLLHSMKAEQFNTQGYELWGNHAYSLLEQLIQDTDNNFHSLAGVGWPLHYFNWLLNFHRAADSRNALRQVMERRRGQEIYLDEEKYTFDAKGINITGSFHAWQVEMIDNKLKFQDIEDECCFDELP
jgi:ABC-type branched-subunit amino acid transport system substrate-binding protein